MYYYLDHDDEPYRELGISGEDYAHLIGTCFRYSTHFSFNIGFLRRKSIEPGLPAPYKTIDKCLLPALCDDIAILPCSEKTKEYLLHTVGDIYEWIDRNGHPEDLIFYRQDGSIFFWSMIHEGVCCLTERPDENISGIVQNPDWHVQSPDEPNFYLPAGLAEFRLRLPDGDL